jgi:DNA-binding cell septation regulator SpoVG
MKDYYRPIHQDKRKDANKRFDEEYEKARPKPPKVDKNIYGQIVEAEFKKRMDDGTIHAISTISMDIILITLGIWLILKMWGII